MYKKPAVTGGSWRRVSLFSWHPARQKIRENGRAYAGLVKSANMLLAGDGGDPLARAVLDRTLTGAGNALAETAAQLQANQITLEDWQLQMADNVQLIQFAGGAAAAGGVTALTLAQLELITGLTVEQLSFLRRFALAIAAGDYLLDGRFLWRTRMYAEAGRGAFYDTAASIFSVQGFDRVRSVRNARDSCRECIAFDGVEYAIGDPANKPPGKRICLTNCLCSEEYINSETRETKFV